jgi:hypothetical protein
MNEELVALYFDRLAQTMGDESFMPIFDQLGRDKGIQQPEAVALACRLAFEIAPSTPKAKALGRILERHKGLYLFKLQQKSIGGRSAA